MESYTIVQKILASRRQTPEKKSPIPFRFQCRCSRDGKIHMKEETGPSGKNSFTYSYDVAGHLEAVRKNGLLVEQYPYDDQGRRIGDFRAWDGEPRDFIYNYDGALIRVNDTYMDWTPAGRLKSVYSASSRTEYEFGRDTRLDRVLLPSGNVVEYRYAKGLMPVAILEDSAPVAECAWEDILGLKTYSDYKSGLD